MTPDVTVIVVTYNHAPFITDALAGVFAQQLAGAIEVIVSDDASTDGTLDVVARVAASRGRSVQVIRSVRNLNSNVVTVRAIEAARGQHVAIMDGDDVWTASDKLQRQREFLRRYADCAVCFHDQTVIDVHGRPLDEATPHGDVPEWTGLADILAGNYVPGSSPMFRRSAVESLPPWVASAPYGDWALLIAAARHGTIGRIPARLVAYRRHDGGVWSGLSDRQRAEGLVAFYDHLEPHIWPDRRDAVRHIRAGWRANLWTLLQRLGDAAAADAAVEHGVAAGDVSQVRRAGRAVTAKAARGGLTVEVIEGAADGPPGIGHLDDIRWDDAGRTLQVMGWGPFGDQDPNPTLLIETEAPAVEGVVVRLTRADVAAAVDPDLRRAGFWLRVRHAERCTRPLRLWARGGQRGVGTIGGWITPP